MALLASPELVGEPLRVALTEQADAYLDGLFEAATGSCGGLALAAVGGYGRREPAVASDLDLVLLHSGRIGGLAAIADRLWYPLWDTGIALDHSVRTVAEAVAVARVDLKAALGLLDARHVAGDRELTGELVDAVRAGWRSAARTRLPELADSVTQRASAHGELAFLLEPDLKLARGGVRDVHALQAVAVAQVADPPAGPVRVAHALLLDARGELHRATGRSGDRLVLQEQAAVAGALGLADADALMAAVSQAARCIAYAGDVTWRRVRRWVTASSRRRWSRGRSGPTRRPLTDGVVEQDGEVMLARGADPAGDPVLLLRAAAAAAGAGLVLAPHALDRLARESASLPQPWPAEARGALVAVLGAGSAAVPVLEALDQAGLVVRLLPEWAAVRCKPQRNAYHRFTVDRHLCETAARAAGLARRVDRPDLLLLGAFLHDIGKGQPGDHTDNGVQLVGRIGPRLGLPPTDVDVLVALVRHHLLLAETATRRDLDDPATTTAVAAAVGGSRRLLDLLHALTEADALATGPAAWSEWKATLVADLVARVGRALTGSPPAAVDPLSGAQRALAERGELAVDVDLAPSGAEGFTVTVTAADRPGLLAQSAGVLALHRLDVRAAVGTSVAGTAVSVFTVATRYGSAPDWSLVREDIRRALSGTLPVAARLSDRERAYARRGAAAMVAPPRVLFFDDASASATVVEVRAHDAAGVLHRIASALADCGLDVRTAKVATLGAEVVDSFYVVDAAGGKVTDPETRSSLERAVLAAVAG